MSENKEQWIFLGDKSPNELETVWAYNNETGFVALACMVYNEGWLWSISNGNIYSEDGKIVSECELDDDYDFTHWMPLPELPGFSKLQIELED
jgi:hypothetical protein